jgi:arylsulfatase
VHLDGYNPIPALKGDTQDWPRKEVVYWSDDGDLMALRYARWKVVFQEQRAEGFKVRSEPFSDPFEKAPLGSIYYSDWAAHRMFLLVPAQAYVAKWISSFKEFPPRQKPSSFSIDAVMKKLEEGPRGN